MTKMSARLWFFLFCGCWYQVKFNSERLSVSQRTERGSKESLPARSSSFSCDLLTFWPVWHSEFFSCAGPSAVRCGRQRGGGQSGEQNSEGQTVSLGRGARWELYTSNFITVCVCVLGDVSVCVSQANATWRVQLMFNFTLCVWCVDDELWRSFERGFNFMKWHLIITHSLPCESPAPVLLIRPVLVVRCHRKKKTTFNSRSK